MQTLVVSAAVLIEDGRVLLSQRKKGSHLSGAWEFPGGKVEPGEDPRDTLVRELAEELGIEVTPGEILEVTFHRYPERAVLLLFFAARRTASSQNPQALDVAAFRWASAAELDPDVFPPADVAILHKVKALLFGGGGAATTRDQKPH
jgi:8-oxo-dGTP diphosphatase